MAETLLPSAQAAWNHGLSSPPWTPCSRKGDLSAEKAMKAPQGEFGVNHSQSKGDGHLLFVDFLLTAILTRVR